MTDVGWTFGGKLLSGIRAQLPVYSKCGAGELITFSSRDDSGRSFGSYSRLITAFPPTLSEPVEMIWPGQAGDYDAAGAMPMQVVEGYLYFIGWTLRKDVPYFNYLSVSSWDGKRVTKLGPILGPDTDDSGYAGTFHVEKVNNKYIGYYLSVLGWEEDEWGQLNPCYDIKIAESTDLVTWRKTGVVAIPLGPGEAGISAFTVVKINHKYHGWFSVRKAKNFRNDPRGGYRIQHATSIDGMSWERDLKYELRPGTCVGADEMVAYPSVYQAGSRLIMLFNGDGFGSDGLFWCHMPVADVE